jgi:hypothetical protein
VAGEYDAIHWLVGADTLYVCCLARGMRRQLPQEEKGQTSFSYSSKRKMTSEISPQVDSAAKRTKQGEMDRVAVHRGIDAGEIIG